MKYPFSVLPIEGADPTVYFVPESTDETQLSLGSGNPIPDSKIASGKVQLTAKKLALRVGFSILLFICILLAWKFGYIQPTGIPLK